MNRRFEARYPGRCSGCEDGIEIGDLLAFDDDGFVQHADCLAKPSGLRKPAEICPRCLSAKAVNGECGCF